MKNIVTLAILSLFIASPAFSQEKKQKTDRIEKMSEVLELTDQQSVELKEYFENARNMRAERKNGERPSKEEIAALKSKHESGLKEILTDEQFEKMKAMSANRKGARGKKGGKRGGKDHGVKPELNLTDDQKVQIKALKEKSKAEMTQLKESQKPEMEKFRTEMKAVRDKYSDSEDKEAMKAEMKEVKSQYADMFAKNKEQKENLKKQFESILTTEQLATLEASKGEKRMHKKKRRPQK